MTEAQRHRGPDAEGAWTDDHCGLGFRRLAVIDLSQRGCQPMPDVTGRLQLVFNGEIYNFEELRRQLRERGHFFRSGTDSETILYAYREWGTDCASHLRGMFAFALWDSEKRRLFMARDRLGKKPLFWALRGTRVAFASEMQGLLADADIPRAVDWAAVDEYLTWGYVPAPSSGLRGVQKLPPATWMTVDVGGADPVVHIERYWRLSYEPKARVTFHEAEVELRHKLTEAVRLRMVSDVPLGAFLSGGIDSSIIVGLMAQLSSRPVSTFSIGFDEAAWSELPHARRIAEKWGTDHHEDVVRPDAMAILPLLARHYGEPYADSSAVPTFYVSQIARREVTVALNGDGGDESFGGYDRYRASELAAAIARVPGSRLASRAIGGVLPDSADPKSTLRRIRRFLEVAHQSTPTRYARWSSYFDDDAKTDLYRGALQPLLAGRRPDAWMVELFATAASLRPADAAMSVDVRSYLPYDLLTKVDITSMAHSLEARSPFLDHELMEFAARLPVHYKMRPRAGKWILRRAFVDLLPRENVNRRKMGFAMPVGEWFRGSMREMLHDALFSPSSHVRDHLDGDALRAMVREHQSRNVDHAQRLWALLMLEMWFREIVGTPS